MKTNTHSLALPIAAIACLLVSSLSLVAQDADKNDTAADPGAAAMEAYMKSIAPGPQHKLLKSLVGTWTTKQTLWMAPGAPAMENAGKANFRMLMGGRFLVQDYASEIPGMGAFKGRGTTGFDNATKEYINTWFDSFGTGIMVSKGKAAPGDEKTVSMEGESVDPLTNQVVKFRIVTKYVSDDRHEMEMYENKDGAEERKIMQIVYTRVSDAGAGSGAKKKEK